jgi:hypothetical protein
MLALSRNFAHDLAAICALMSTHLSELVDPAIWEKAQEQTKSGGNDLPPFEL